MPKDYVESEQIEKWVTLRSGARVPIYKGKTLEESVQALRSYLEQKKSPPKVNNAKFVKPATIKTQSEHIQAIKELDTSKYEDGTYNIATKKTVNFSNGFQVTFCQVGDNYTDDEYADKVNECLKLSSDGKTYAGKFEGTPEISFHCNDRKQAVEYGKKNNQVSVLDWAELQKANKLGEKYGWDSTQYLEQLDKAFISTDGTGRRK